MHFYLSIDDTDNTNSPGSGQLADTLAGKLKEQNLAEKCGPISRHQLYIHDSVPYTSHNSSMCFTAETSRHILDKVIKYSQTFLMENSAEGSDPGLCVVTKEDCLDLDSLISFGLKAKSNLITKKEAILLAEKTGVHLSEHGGTGDGIIGALAGTGLRIMGNDGRVRGWLHLDGTNQVIKVDKLLSNVSVDAVINNSSQPLSADTSVLIADTRLKTILYNHLSVIPVIKSNNTFSPKWRTLSRDEIKKF